MRLNIGCGTQVVEGWVNIDADHTLTQLDGIEHGDPLEGLPYDDDSIEGAVAHHVLQMVDWLDLVPWLREVRRVLAPGAWLRITVPDFLRAVTAARRGDVDWFPIEDAHERSIDGKLCLYVSQAGATRSVFTSSWLSTLCLRAGFTPVVVAAHLDAVHEGPEWLRALDSRGEESIVVEARA